jgi:hypothetical protein
MWLWCNVSTVMRMGWGQGRNLGNRCSVMPWSRWAPCSNELATNRRAGCRQRSHGCRHGCRQTLKNQGPETAFWLVELTGFEPLSRPGKMAVTLHVRSVSLRFSPARYLRKQLRVLTASRRVRTRPDNSPLAVDNRGICDRSRTPRSRPH